MYREELSEILMKYGIRKNDSSDLFCIRFKITYTTINSEKKNIFIRIYKDKISNDSNILEKIIDALFIIQNKGIHNITKEELTYLGIRIPDEDIILRINRVYIDIYLEDTIYSDETEYPFGYEWLNMLESLETFIEEYLDDCEVDDV